MKHVAGFSIIFLHFLPLFGWEPEPELSLEGVLRTAERQRMTRYPDGIEEKWVERHTVLVADKPITLSRSISIENQQTLVQQESLPFIRVLMGEEYNSLLGKRVQLHGRLTKPIDFFLLKDITFDVDTALDVEWQQTHQTKTVFYEPSVTELKGSLFQKTYPGPPNYESIEDGDMPETPIILALSEPIDVQAALPEDDFNQPEKEVREVQILFDGVPPEDLWEQGIVVKGTLFSAHTGHHRRRVLMEVNDWEPIKEKAEVLLHDQR